MSENEKSHEIFSRLLSDRIVFLGYPINEHVANIVTSQMLFLATENDKLDINLYLNTPGGSISAGLGIYDTMQYVECDVSTVCIGMAGGMGAILLAAGTKGKRFALPHSQIVLCPTSGGLSYAMSEILRETEDSPSIASESGLGSLLEAAGLTEAEFKDLFDDIEEEIAKPRIKVEETDRKLNKMLNEILAEHTGQPVKKVERDSDREFYITSEHAKEYGIIDDVIMKIEEMSFLSREEEKENSETNLKSRS